MCLEYDSNLYQKWNFYSQIIESFTNKNFMLINYLNYVFFLFYCSIHTISICHQFLSADIRFYLIVMIEEIHVQDAGTNDTDDIRINNTSHHKAGSPSQLMIDRGRADPMCSS